MRISPVTPANGMPTPTRPPLSRRRPANLPPSAGYMHVIEPGATGTLSNPASARSPDRPRFFGPCYRPTVAAGGQPGQPGPAASGRPGRPDRLRPAFHRQPRPAHPVPAERAAGLAATRHLLRRRRRRLHRLPTTTSQRATSFAAGCVRRRSGDLAGVDSARCSTIRSTAFRSSVPDPAAGSTTNTWNGSPQRELITNPLSGKLGADHTPTVQTPPNAVRYMSVDAATHGPPRYEVTHDGTEQNGPQSARIPSYRAVSAGGGR